MATGDAELRIVNSMLTVVGETTQATLETLHPSVIQMRSIIDSQDYIMQSRGWWFNREIDVTLVKDFNGRVTVPATCMAFSIAHSILKNKTGAEKARYAQRGSYVYDTILHTNVLNLDLVADMVIRLPLDDLPPVAITYLQALCKEEANLGDDGDMSKQSILKEGRVTAWGNLYAKELSTLEVNALQSPQAQALQYRSSGTGVNPNIIGG